MGIVKVGIEIPDGSYCRRCMLLEAGCSAAYDHCRLFPKDEAEADDEGIIKHKSCPSRLLSRVKAVR